MDDKKQNEILQEQKRAREEFLKLKKMQSGDIKAEPKPSEVAITPKTFKEKTANVWFHYKFQILITAFLTIALSFLIAQCSSRINYDLQIVYFTETPIFEPQIEAIENYFEDLATDINNDGEVNVQIVDCSFSESDMDQQYKNANIQKLQSIIVANEKAMLFITDGKKYSFLDNGFNTDEFFTEEKYMLDEVFYESIKVEGFEITAKDLSISCREINGTMIEDEKNSRVCYNEATRILNEIKAK